ncbi:hypothetical protein BGC07_10830 [Piscirickettsia litoralis]|uniref:Uncharacterized protein n=1 Tax=Piscirickettsia litoralis TaxID=1891921 RepID=A0ABX3A6L1_9GAMM|nr:hypothetical protein BGC07_10830 [Piscirickettsia litoralis]
MVVRAKAVIAGIIMLSWLLLSLPSDIVMKNNIMKQLSGRILQVINFLYLFIDKVIFITIMDWLVFIK